MDVLYPPGMTSIAAGDLPGRYLQNCREGAKAWEARNPNQLFSAAASRFCSAESIFFHSYSAISIANRLARFVKIHRTPLRLLHRRKFVVSNTGPSSVRKSFLRMPVSSADSGRVMELRFLMAPAGRCISLSSSLIHGQMTFFIAPVRQPTS